jgi:hypothetical protein
MELKNLLDGSALRSLFATRLKPNSFVGFTQTLILLANLSRELEPTSQNETFAFSRAEFH